MPEPLTWIQMLAVFALAYLLGSIPFGLLLTKAAGLGDIRKVGSGNIGATNVLRTGRKGLALATLLLDGGKGAAAVFLAWRFFQVEDAALLAAVGSVLGHNYPLWLKFKGGKGVATALGVLLMLSLPVGLASCLTWLSFALLFRLSSLASLMALAFAPLYALFLPGAFEGVWATGSSHFILAATLLAALIWWRHKANIGRLLKGQEPKIGQKKN